MKTSRFFLIAVILSVFTLNAFAYSKGQYQKAEKLIQNLQFEKIMEQQIGTVMEGFDKDPRFSEFKKELQSVFLENADLKSIKSECVKFYAENFTEKELEGLTQFYQTPVGQKFIAKVPELNQRLLPLVHQHFLVNEAKLQGALEALVAKSTTKAQS